MNYPSLPQSFQDSFEFLISFVETAVNNDDRGDPTAKKVEEEQFDVTVEFIIVATETVVEAGAGFVESKSEVVPVNYHLAVTQLFSLEEISSV